MLNCEVHSADVVDLAFSTAGSEEASWLMRTFVREYFCTGRPSVGSKSRI